MKLVYSRESIQDLVRLREFIASKNPAAANQIATQLIARIQQLCMFPAMGRPVELAPVPESIRDFIFGDYIVRYSVYGDALSILRIWHQLENIR
ncbi:MAG: type II toxin-antitoxin system RelE/ParE family toxin [Cellvibrio sp.]